MTMIINGTSGVTFPNSTVQVSAAQSYRTRVLSTGTTYTVPSDVRALYVFVVGATGGRPADTFAYGGRGGCGYSETYYASPAASYTYSIGAAGAITPTAGGTTTFGAMSVTGGGAVSTTAGGTGGIGSGGTFNATGGAGGTSTGATSGIGGAGGAGSRGGNGGTGGNAVVGTSGGGGGTGGNNASGATGGSAGTVSGSAISLAFFPTGTTETLNAGTTSVNVNNAGGGASNSSSFNALVAGAFFPASGTSLVLFNASATLARVPSGTATDGIQGLICIIEVL